MYGYDSVPSTPQNQAEAHYKGHKHARKLKAMEAAKNKQRPPAPASEGAAAAAAEAQVETPASETSRELQSEG